MFSLIQGQKTHRRSRRMNRLLREASRTSGAIENLEARTLLTVPALSSLEGAPVTVFLDFDGHVESGTTWTEQNNNGNDIVTPPFDSDGDVSDDFSPTEQAQIEEIWARVAEDFSPFDVNVTTVDPGEIIDYQSINVAIGGDGFIDGAGGVAYRNSFSNSAPNTVFAFVDGVGGGDATHNIASVISHEAGHAFGLRHHSLYDDNGNFVTEYHPGFGEWGPIMGVGYGVDRDVWYDGPANNGVDDLQADMEYLTRSANRTFEFREDDHGDSRGDATSPTFGAGGEIDISGNIIATHLDSDFFEINTDDGSINFTASALDLEVSRSQGNNLDIVLNVYNESGSLLATSDPSDSYDATVELEVARGTYYVEVTSIDQYGSAGQYDFTGNIVPLPVIPEMLSPAGFTNEARPIFTWTLAANTRSYQLVVDNLTTGEQNFLEVDGITGTSYRHDVAFTEGQYQAQVRQLNNEGQLSDFSAPLAFQIDIERPGTGEVISPQGLTTPSPEFAWTEFKGADSYLLVVRNVDTDQVVLRRAGIQDTSYTHFAPLSAGDYATTVTAVNEAGEAGVPSRELEFTVESTTGAVPVITSPGDETRESILRPLYTWTGVDGAVSYDVKVTNLSTGTVAFEKSNVTDTRYKTTKNQKLEQGTYLVQVRAVDILGAKTEYSDAHRFTVDILRPTKPVVTGPDGTVSTQKPTFTFEASRRAKKYNIIVVDGDDRVLNKTINKPDILEYTSTVKLPESDDLTVFIAGINSVGEIGNYAELSFAIAIETPASPTVTGPARNTNGTVADPTPTITWSAVAHADSYDLKVVDLTEGRTVIRERRVVGTSFTPEDALSDNHQYRVTVIARNTAGDRSKKSDNYDFLLQQGIPTTPVMFGPGGDVTTEFPIGEWQNVDHAARFRLFVKDLNTGSVERFTFRNWDVSPDGQVASYQLPDAQAEGTYQMWVQAISSSGVRSGYSNAVTYTVVQTSSEGIELPEDLMLPGSVLEPVVTEPVAPSTEPEVTLEVPAVIVDQQEQPVATPVEVAPLAEVVDPSQAPADAFVDAEWWTGNLTEDQESVESSEDDSAAGEIVAVAAGVFAVPLMAAKLLKRVRNRKKKQK